MDHVLCSKEVEIENFRVTDMSSGSPVVIIIVVVVVIIIIIIVIIIIIIIKIDEALRLIPLKALDAVPHAHVDGGGVVSSPGNSELETDSQKGSLLALRSCEMSNSELLKSHGK